MNEQGSFFDDDAEYASFRVKFKPKKTTDDCYTPAPVYDAIAGWVSEEYGLNRKSFVRPFYPGGDYERFSYPQDGIVVDNPPFSILGKIIRFFTHRKIRYFLFGPTLTLFTSAECPCCYLPCGVTITYENGAEVNTSFVTNLDKMRIRVCPELYRLVDIANKRNLAEVKQKVPLPKYRYPDEVLTAANIYPLARVGFSFSVPPDEARYISALDAQKRKGKSIFGGGFLLSRKAAAEKAAAEKAAAEVWKLSDRENAIIDSLGDKAADDLTEETQTSFLDFLGCGEQDDEDAQDEE